MFCEKYDAAKLNELLMPIADWEPFAKASNRDAWHKLLEKPLNQFRKKNMIERAEKHLNKDWPVLPAHLYMEFVTNGNRTNYETMYFDRRERFAELVMAECFEYDGRFFNDILNGFWSILEETSWCVPAHHFKHEGDPLPDSNEEIADLFSCQTANIIGEAYYLLKEKLFEFSPNLCFRIKKEIKRRVLDVFSTDHCIGWKDGHNNWAIWCSSNILGAAMHTLDDPGELSVIVVKLFEVFDRYYDNYADDGGCDEGPNYWGVSPGVMTIFLEYLRDRSRGEINIYDDPKIKRMANFIADAHISKEYFINFADAGVKANPDKGLTYRLGEMTGQEEMQKIVVMNALKWNEQNSVDEIPIGSPVLNLMLRDLFWFKASKEEIKFNKKKQIWYTDTEIIFCRESNNPDKGLFCAMKAGHNGENHNHNDVGHFILYSEGRPCVLDVGVETYSKITFSSERYTLDFMRSSGHNIPTINGCEQLPKDKFRDKEFSSKNVVHSFDDNSSELNMELKDLYSEESQLKSFQRHLTFLHEEGKAIVTDKFEFNKDNNELEINFYCQNKPILENDGSIKLLSLPDLKMTVSDRNMKFEVIEVPIVDQTLKRSWTSPLYKLNGKINNLEKRFTISYEYN